MIRILLFLLTLPYFLQASGQAEHMPSPYITEPDESISESIEVTNVRAGRRTTRSICTDPNLLYIGSHMLPDTDASIRTFTLNAPLLMHAITISCDKRVLENTEYQQRYLEIITILCEEKKANPCQHLKIPLSSEKSIDITPLTLAICNQAPACIIMYLIQKAHEKKQLMNMHFDGEENMNIFHYLLTYYQNQNTIISIIKTLLKLSPDLISMRTEQGRHPFQLALDGEKYQVALFLEKNIYTNPLEQKTILREKMFFFNTPLRKIYQ